MQQCMGHHIMIRVLLFRRALKTQFNAWDLSLGWGLPLKSLELLLGARIFPRVKSFFLRPWLSLSLVFYHTEHSAGS